MTQNTVDKDNTNNHEESVISVPNKQAPYRDRDSQLIVPTGDK